MRCHQLMNHNFCCGIKTLTYCHKAKQKVALCYLQQRKWMKSNKKVCKIKIFIFHIFIPNLWEDDLWYELALYTLHISSSYRTTPSRCIRITKHIFVYNFLIGAKVFYVFWNESPREGVRSFISNRLAVYRYDNNNFGMPKATLISA